MMRRSPKHSGISAKNPHSRTFSLELESELRICEFWSLVLVSNYSPFSFLLNGPCFRPQPFSWKPVQLKCLRPVTVTQGIELRSQKVKRPPPFPGSRR